MDQVVHRLKNSKSLLLATHVNPDGDAIGSLLSMGLALDELKKNIQLYCESPIPTVYRFLPWSHRVSRHIGDVAAYDTALVLDCGDLRRVGHASDRISQIPDIINMDHHATNTGFGTIQIVKTEACATAEIVYYLIRKMDININKLIARCIYTGILSDTGSFRFLNTNMAAFEICKDMVAAGVNPYEVAKHVYGQYSLARIKLLNLALDSLEISNNGKLSMMTVTSDMMKDSQTQNEDVEGMINYARRIKDVKVAVLIQEVSDNQMKPGIKNRFHVSLRSDGAVDVGNIAKDFGGGGHPTAAGFCINSTLYKIKSAIFNLAEGF
jgi:phosphoesterase RecJ-like protein